MATPKPEFCSVCGGFTGQHQNTEEDISAPLGQHEQLEECVRELDKKVERLEEKIKLIDVY